MGKSDHPGVTRLAENAGASGFAGVSRRRMDKGVAEVIELARFMLGI